MIFKISKNRFFPKFTASSFLLSNILLFLTSISIFAAIISGFIIFVDQKLIVLTTNKIANIPSKKHLFQLRSLTYKNHTLFKSSSNYIISDHELEVVALSENTGEITVIKSLLENTEEENENYNVECSGVCSCYIDDELRNEQDRKLGQMVLSRPYTSVVVVSLVGYAVSRFVSDHWDDCYSAARKVLGEDSPPFMCSMDDINCDDDKSRTRSYDGRNVVRRYTCNGRCMLKPVYTLGGVVDTFFSIFNVPYKSLGSKTMKGWCEGRYAGEKVLRVDPAFVNVEHEIWAVKRKYSAAYLDGFCRGLSVRIEGRLLYPCTKGIASIPHNIECKELLEVDEQNE